MLLKGYMKIIFRSNIVVRLLSYILFLSLVWAVQPDWEDTPNAYLHTASMTADVLIEGNVIGDYGDILAAFDESGDVRGIGTMIDGLGDYEGVTLHAITIRGNAAGDEISFKYYDASAEIIHNLAESYTFAINDMVGNLMDPHILSYEYEQVDNCLELHEGSNLISFSTTLPQFSDFPDCIEAILGAGEAAVHGDDGWYGSLIELSCEDGYWVVYGCDSFEWCYEGMECSDSISYSLYTGANLVSYSLSECRYIEEVLPNDVQDCVNAIGGEGQAALNLGGNWAGSLTALCPDDGYWFVSECDIEFTYNESTSLARQQILSPSPYPYHQSSQQAFYFIESVEDIVIGDWIIAYNRDQVIGARAWTGEIIDVPAMGDDGTDFTAGYIQTGTIPTFKLLKDGELIDLVGDIPAFENNQLYIVQSLSEAIALPATFSLDRAYPNPFNPTTTLSFALPIEAEVSLAVYNLQGRQVISLIDQNMEAGYHSVVWNADSYSSGMYFVKMVAGDYISTQKLMLVK